MTRIFAKLSHLWAPSEDELLDIYLIMYITPYYFRKVYNILLEMDDSQVDTRWTIPDPWIPWTIHDDLKNIGV